MHQEDIKFYYGNFLFLVVPELDDGDGKVEVTESVPLTAEALETLFWQQFQTTATQTSGCQTPENVQIVRKYDNALIEAWCHPGHTISGTVSQVGKRFSYKDEREWKRRRFLIVYRKLILPDK